MSEHKAIISVERIEKNIFLIRGHKVMLDIDLASLYGVEARALNQAVKRNVERFPSDFMFQLTKEEVLRSRSQFVTLKRGRGSNVKYLPHAFTEQGVAMLSSVLKSKKAIQVNIEIMRSFVKLRSILSSHKELVKRLDEMESKYDKQFKAVFDAIRELMTPIESKRERIGFRVGGAK